MAMSDPAGFRGSIGVPLPRVDPKYDAGLTSGLYQASKTIRRVRLALRTPAASA